jgi:ketosteroid isomerase-like protein
MKHIAARAVAVLISVMLVVSAAAQQDQAKGKKSGKSGGGNVEEQIKKMEQDRAQAVVKGDAATLEKLTADDYMFIDRFGNVSDKASTMSRIKSGDIKLTSNELSDLKVRVYGNTAVVTGKSETKGTVGGRDTSGPVLFTRVYVKKNAKWQAVQFQQTPAGGQ